MDKETQFFQKCSPIQTIFKFYKWKKKGIILFSYSVSLAVNLTSMFDLVEIKTLVKN